MNVNAFKLSDEQVARIIHRASLLVAEDARPVLVAHMYELAYAHNEFVTKLDAEGLDAVFEKMNVVDGSELPVKLKKRSMSCGDVAVDSEGNVWFCASVGWQHVHWNTP